MKLAGGSIGGWNFLLIVFIGFLTMAGCGDSTSGMERFTDPVLLCSEEANRYVVKHNIGRMYTVEPIGKCQQNPSLHRKASEG